MDSELHRDALLGDAWEWDDERRRRRRRLEDEDIAELVEELADSLVGPPSAHDCFSAGNAD